MKHSKEVQDHIFDIMNECQLGVRRCFMSCLERLSGGCHCTNNRVFHNYHGQNAYHTVARFLEHVDGGPERLDDIKTALREMLADALQDARKQGTEKSQG